MPDRVLGLVAYDRSIEVFKVSVSQKEIFILLNWESAGFTPEHRQRQSQPQPNPENPKPQKHTAHWNCDMIHMENRW